MYWSQICDSRSLPLFTLLKPHQSEPFMQVIVHPHLHVMKHWVFETLVPYTYTVYLYDF